MRQREWPVDLVSSDASRAPFGTLTQRLAHVANLQIEGVFIPSHARGADYSPMCKTALAFTIQQPETACHLLTTRGPSCTMDCGSSKIEEGLQAYCKNQPPAHGQLAGISKLNPRRLGTRFLQIGGAERPRQCAARWRVGQARSSRARGDKNLSLSNAEGISKPKKAKYRYAKRF